MRKYFFTGAHRVEIDTDKIGFPEPFYHAVYPEKQVVLAVIRNLLTGEKSLIGYKTGMWRFLESHLTALCDFPQVMPLAIREFLNNAVECKIIAPPPPKEDEAKRLQKTIASEDHVLQVPPKMIQQASIENRAVLVGHVYHFEVWTLNDWLRIRKEQKSRISGRIYLSSLHADIPDIVA